MARGCKPGLPLLALMGAVLALWAAPAMAQVAGPLAPAEPPRDRSEPLDRPIQVAVEMVLVNVTVTDLQDRPQTGLEKDDFRILENDVEQEIVSFSHEDAPTSIGLLFDMSNSMANKVDKAKRAALQILKTANPQDEFFLVTFGNRAELTSPFTSDLAELEARLMTVRPKGQTALLDAIALGIGQMRQARNRKRAFVVISDGGDNHSRATEKSIRSELREADSQLYAVGIFDERDMKRTREEREGPALLSEFAELTGGRVFTASSSEELSSVADRMSRELRDQYVLGYRPGRPHDGAWRTIKVRAAEQEDLPALRIRAKTGYYAPNERP